MNQVTDEKGNAVHHVVGVGASAGGLEAIESLFSHMPVDSGLAFIVVQHLSPDYKSLMVELLSKRTAMTVLRAEDGMEVEPNHIYMIPPKKELTIFHGKLVLNDKEAVRGINLPIDIFLRSLAEDMGDRAIAIILSGTGSDGTRGVRAIKENGGMVMVQDEASAKFDGMPRAAVSTGVADFILPPEEMPAQMLAFLQHPYVKGGAPGREVIKDERGMTRIFSELRERTKVDFTYYKPSTISRRIERRMTVNQINHLEEYVRFLQQYPAEVMTLYREMLIGVTSFFRDPKSMEELRESILPELFQNEEKHELRFWVAGCSTGEEAYTIAILAKEVMEKTGMNRDVKIFATDLDRNAVAQAGNGVYPESIAADLSPHLLGKYFYRNEDNYRIARNIREMVVFAQHNLVMDPPFTKIDLISCRNLLIYLQPILQEKALKMFRFSLKPGGIMFLGASETIGNMTDSFEPVNQRCKIYRSKGLGKVSLSEDHTADERRISHRHRFGFSRDRRNMVRPFKEDSLLMERFLTTAAPHYLPLSLVVNNRLEVVHIFGETRGFLGVPSGRAGYDITKMAVNGLAIPLATGIHRAFQTMKEVGYSNIRIQEKDGENRLVKLRIIPLPASDRSAQGLRDDDMVGVFLEEVDTAPASVSKSEIAYDLDEDIRQRVKDLERELQFSNENLQATIEELETSNEELQATNEELLASNEELQSTNEELQSTNEELFTVNSEHQSKIMELTQLNNDVENLLSSSGIGILMLDENLEIRRYSQNISRIFHILEKDIGRPIHHLSHSLEDFNVLDAVKHVQEKDTGFSMERMESDGTTWMIRVIPYTIGPKTYSGFMLTFVDVSELKQAKQDLRSLRENKAQELVNMELKYNKLFETISQGVVYQNTDGEIISANPAASRILGLSPDQIMGKTSRDPRWRAIRPDGSDLPAEEHPSMIALAAGKKVKRAIMGIARPGTDAYCWLQVCAIPEYHEDDAGAPFQVFTIFEEIAGETGAVYSGECHDLPDTSECPERPETEDDPET